MQQSSRITHGFLMTIKLFFFFKFCNFASNYCYCMFRQGHEVFADVTAKWYIYSYILVEGHLRALPV